LAASSSLDEDIIGEAVIDIKLGSVEDVVSFVGDIVGHSVSSFSFRGEVTIGEAVSDTELGIEEVGLMTVSTPDCVGGAEGEGVVKGDDFVIQSSLLT